MPFLPNDHYTTSGDVKLLNSWRADVYKFDTSSFYNWEQDNEPIHDLEERTHLLWEREGYPTSSVPGLALAVSADADDSALECNPNLFTDVSSAIKALPEVLRFPVILEVASYGDLGTLELNNLKCAQGGSLEIINRNFAKIYSSGAAIEHTTTFPYSVTSITSADVSTTFVDASALSISTPVVSSTSPNVDERFTKHNRAVWQSGGFDVNFNRTHKLTCVPISQADLASNTVNEFQIANIYDDGILDSTIPNHDVSAKNQGNAAIVRRLEPNDGTAQGIGLIYGNYFRRIKIQNCDGPIYVRNFVVDGTTTDIPSEAAQTTEIGIEVNNSNIVLENCTAERCRDAGIQFSNSKVVVARGLVGYRNYKRLGAVRDPLTKGVGWKMVNSDVTLSSSDPYSASGIDFLLHFAHNDIGIEMVNSTLKGGISRSYAASGTYASHLQASYNGREFFETSTLPFGEGIRMENSTLDINGCIDLWNNSRGLVAYGSNITLDECSVENNYFDGIKATNSIITYNKQQVALQPLTDLANSNHYITPLFCSGNGQHLVLDHSTMRPRDVSAMPSNVGQAAFHNSHGTDVLGVSASYILPNTLPSIEIANGSKLELAHGYIQVLTDSDEGFARGHSVAGAALSVKNGSKVKLQGSTGGASMIWGPSLDQNQRRTAGVYSSNGSEVEFNGPTIITRFGIDVLAEDNSTITFKPHNSENGLDVSAWNLSDTGNHTSVELHAIRSCLVANRGSVINMEDLGDYHAFWEPSSFAGSAAYNPSDERAASSYMNTGSMQFYPNPEDIHCNQDPLTHAFGRGRTSLGDDPIQRLFKQKALPDSPGGNAFVNYFLVDPLDSDEVKKNTFGGNCLRAVGNSYVNVKNVHFPTGWEQASAPFYDCSTDCHQLWIWNIADNSQLNVAHASVSGMYPASAGYHGPGALWASGTSPPTTDKASSGAPYNVPDTGILSVLDDFAGGWGEIPQVATPYLFHPPQVDRFTGHVSSTNPQATKLEMGTSDGSWQNQGPFRLYFSVDPIAKNLLTCSAGPVQGATAAIFLANLLSHGPAAQIFAQGYNLSSAASALPDSVVSYPTLNKFEDTNLNGSWDTSSDFGWWNCNELVQDANDRVWLDESAANTFANAKMAAQGTSNRPKLVTIYRSTNTVGGEDFDTSSANAGFGLGFRTSNVFDLGTGNER